MRSPNIYSFWQKTISFVLLFIFFLTQGVPGLFGIGSAVAAGKSYNDLVVILVQDNLYEPGQELYADAITLSQKIHRYAEDIRKNLNSSKTLILQVSDDISPLEIRDTLERFYFDGDINDFEENYLSGLVLIGDIPLAEVYESAELDPVQSIAPYTDFRDKAYSYTLEEEKFINTGEEFHPEIWHGIIPFVSEEELGSYLDENHRYYSGENIVEKDLWYADFIEESSRLNSTQFDLYQNTINHAEDIAYKRLTNKFLQKLMGNFKDSLKNIYSDTDAALRDIAHPEEADCPFGVCPDPKEFMDNTLATLPNEGVGAPDIFSAFQLKNVLPEYGKVAQGALQEAYDNVSQSGRWEEEDIEYFAKEITLRDISMRESLKHANDLMQEKIRNYVEKSWQVPIQIPVFKKIQSASLYTADSYEVNYLYGQRTSDIQSAEQCTWFRGSQEKDADDLSQLIMMNRTFDTSALSCNGFAGCCLQNYGQPQSCNHPGATSSVVSLSGSRTVSDTNFQAASYRNCLEENWQRFNAYSSPNLPQTQIISSVFVHDEPRNSTLKAQSELQFVPNFPVDSLPYIDFQNKDLEYVRINFPNIFDTNISPEAFMAEERDKIRGLQNNVLPKIPADIKRIKKEIEEIEFELDSLDERGASKVNEEELETELEFLQIHLENLEKEFSLLEDDFFIELFSNDFLVSLQKSIEWRDLSISEKYERVFKEMIMQSSQQNKNELLYLRGYVSDNAEMLMHMNPKANEKPDAMKRLWEKQKRQSESENFVNNDIELDEKCGSYKGVEITEWFSAVQCWLKEVQNTGIADTKTFKNSFQESWENAENNSQNFVQTWAEDASNDSVDLEVATIGIAEKVSLIRSDDTQHLFPVSLKLLNASGELIPGLFSLEVRLPDGVYAEVDGEEFEGEFPLSVIFGEAQFLLWSEKEGVSEMSLELEGKRKKVALETLGDMSLQLEKVEIVQKGPYTLGNISIKTEQNFFGNIPVSLSADDRVSFPAESFLLNNGRAEIPVIFQASPEQIPFTVSSSLIANDQTFSLPIQEQTPAKFIVENNAYVKSGETMNLKVQIADEFGVPIAKDFGTNFDYKIFITPDSNKYSSFKSRKISFVNGEAIIPIPTNKSSGDIHLAFMGDDMETEIMSIYSRTHLNSKDFTNSSSVFSYFAQEGNGDGKTFVKQMLLSGTMSIAHKIPEKVEGNIEFYESGIGWGGEDISILELAARMPFAQAFMSGQTQRDIFWGDPVLSYSLGRDDIGVSNYDKTLGEEVYFSDDEIKDLKTFDYNNDSIADLLILSGGRNLQLLEGRPGNTFIKRYDYGLAAEGISSIETGDFSGDGAEDILVASNEKKVYLFENSAGDIRPEVEAFESAANQIYSMQVFDMNKDDFDDVVVSNSRGELRIYWGSANSCHPGLDSGSRGGAEILKQVQNDNNCKPFPNSELIASFGTHVVTEDAVDDVVLSSSEQLPVLSKLSPNVVENIKGAGTKISTGHKYYSLAEGKRNPVDLDEEIFVDIFISKSQFASAKLVIDHLPDPFEFSEVVECSPLVIPAEAGIHTSSKEGLIQSINNLCPAQSFPSSSSNIVFGPFENIQEDLHIRYLARVSQTPNIRMSIDEENAVIELPDLQKQYRYESGVFKESELILRSYSSIDAPSQNQEEDLSLPQLVQQSFGILPPSASSAASNEELSWDKELEGKLNEGIKALDSLRCARGGCFATPFNRAFMVPGKWVVNTPPPPAIGNLLNLNVSLSGIPVGANPSPFPIFGINSSAYSFTILNGCTPPVSLPMPCIGSSLCYEPGVFPLPGSCLTFPKPDVLTSFRMYLSPTLTGGLGMAFCKGPMPLASALDPTGLTGGKCAAFALPVNELSGGKCEEIQEDLSEMYSKAQNFVKKNKTVVLSVDGSKYESNITSKPKRKGVNVGIETFKRDLSTGKNQATFPYFSGLGTVWLGAQKEQLAKLLQLPHITLYYPQMGAVFSGGVDDQGNKIEKEKSLKGKWDKAVENLNKSVIPAQAGIQSPVAPFSRGTQSQISKTGDEEKEAQDESLFGQLSSSFKEGSQIIKETTDKTYDKIDEFQEKANELKNKIENPTANIESLENLQGVMDVIENIPFFVVEKKPVNIRIPWANPHELSSLIAELESWVKLTKKDWNRFISMKNQCYSLVPDAKGNKKEELNPVSVAPPKKTGSHLISTEDINVFFKALPSKVLDASENTEYKAKVCKDLLQFSAGFDMTKLIKSVEGKLEILNTYKRFPRELAKYKSGLSYYIADALNYVNAFLDMVAGWNTRQKKIVEKYIQLIYTITEVLTVWKDLTGVYEDYAESCSKCKVEAHSQDFNLFSLIVSATGILPPPVIQFPKWPDIIIDLSHVEAGVKIILPELHVFTDEVDFNFDMKPLKFPDTLDGALDFSINFELPAIPLPDFPPLKFYQLPEFPSLPLPKLPDLPPPPKIPSILDCIGSWIDLIRVILKFYCMITEGFWVYSESSLTGIIEALTNRSSKSMLDIDFNFLQWPDISYPTIESINIDGYVNIEPGTADLHKPVKEFADGFNEGMADTIQGVQRSIQRSLDGLSSSLDRQIQEFNGESGKFQQKILKELKDAQKSVDTFEDSVQDTIDKNKQSSLDGLNNQQSEQLSAVSRYSDNPPSLSLSSRASGASREIPLGEAGSLNQEKGISPLVAPLLGRNDNAKKSIIRSLSQLDDLKRGFQVTSIDTSNFKKLQKELVKALEKESYESQVLARTNSLLALKTVKETPDFVLAANSDISQLQEISASNTSEAMKSVQKTMNNIQDHNAENAQRIYENGIYIFNTETNKSESVLSYTKGSDPVRGLHISDFDKDSDDDIFYALGRRVFLKESYSSSVIAKKGGGILRQAQDDKSGAQGSVFPYPNSTQIGNLDSYFPNYRSAEDIIISNGNATVYISWKEDPSISGYILERKNLIYGFDENHKSPSDFVYLLKDELKNNNDIYNLKKGDTSLTKDYIDPEYQWEMENDFYYLKIYGIRVDGKISTASPAVLLAPQRAFDTRAPLLVENPKERVSVVKEHPISAGYTDTETEFFWYEKDNKLFHDGDVLSTSFESLGTQSFQILAKDEAGNTTAYQKNVEVFSPQVIITKADENEIRGRLEPPEPFMPFTIVRKRNDTFKMLKPKQSERFYSDKDGNFVIKKDDYHSGVRVNDASGNFIAVVNSQTGFITLEDQDYKLSALAATDEHPTQMIILKGDELAARISYISGGKRVQIVADASFESLSDKEVSLSDESLEDGIDILPIPENAKYFPGGAALIGAEKALLAAISPQGSIRIISPLLKIDFEQIDERLFFLIKNSSNDILAKVNIGEMMSSKVSFQSEDLGSKQASISSLALQEWIPAFAGMTENLIPRAYAEEASSSSAPSISDYIESEDDISIEGERKSLEMPFSDLNPSHTYYQAIQDLYYRNILKGYDDGTFQPNAKITRAEFLKVALGSTGCFDCGSPDEATKSLFQERKPFPDIYLPDWYYYCVSIGKKEGMVKGYGDGQFHPNKNISRKEAVAVLLRQIGAELEEMPENYFSDVPEYDWAKDYVYTAVSMGLIKNTGGFTFPNQEISRGEFAFMASRILENRACREYPEYNDNLEGKLGVLSEAIQAELEREKDLLAGALEEEDDVLVDSQVLDDGTRIDTFADGRKELLDADGTKTILYPNGFAFTEFPDGSKRIKTPDGTEITFLTDGTIQNNGTIQIKNPDGSEAIEKANGDIIQISPSGEESLTSPVSSSVLDDGTKVFEYSDGSKKTISPSGVHTHTGPDGTISTKDPVNAQVETLTPEGINSVQKNDGSLVTTFPDGRVETLRPDSTEFIDLPNGTRTVRQPDGTQITTDPSGQRDMVFPDGTREIRSPDGAKETRKPNGEIVFETPDGTQRLLLPDGTEEVTSPNGVKIITRPDGTKTVFTPDNRDSLFDNDGSDNGGDNGSSNKGPLNKAGIIQTTSPDGTKTTQLPNGTTTVEEPDGTTTVFQPDGTRQIFQTDGITITRFADGQETRETLKSFGFPGICSEFSGGLCPTLPENFSAPSGLLVEPGQSSIFSPLTDLGVVPTQCIIVDNLDDISNDDSIFGVVVSSDGKRIFSKGNELKVE